MGNQAKVLVTGAGGFIGHHLVSYLKSLGYWVRGADAKAPVRGEPGFICAVIRCRARHAAKKAGNGVCFDNRSRRPQPGRERRVTIRTLNELCIQEQMAAVGCMETPVGRDPGIEQT